ncbi:extracellular solute-binding protein [Paenibacillus eucommiae]|uniref:Aldouronate transport system substrate-binding protein n=1 Tax=Paenibacillus eucommiae TaxID=1355755 RepID=A0ABS4IVP7_9BACL|nr:extracellular solute-binding protein [Paenibacillus eucommiae]MBP1991066.1 putative aldouronate transport system substrate-binding protein [Paenibacillus eucommiae]
MKSKAFSIILLLLLLITLSGCQIGKGVKGGLPAATGPIMSPSQYGESTVVAMAVAHEFIANKEYTDQVHKRIMKETGIDLQMVYAPRAQAANRAKQIMSKGEQLDILYQMTIDEAVEWYRSGGILGLNDLIEENGPNLKKNLDPRLWEEVTVNGQIIGIPGDAPVSSPRILQIRKDWLDNLGMDVPETIDEFEAVLDAFINKDPDGNGVRDTVALMAGKSEITDLEAVFAPYFMPQAMEWWVDEDGTLLPPELHPSYKQLLLTLQRWYDKGYIYPYELISKLDQKKERLGKNQVGATAGWFSDMIFGAGELLHLTRPSANYLPIMLKGEGINRAPKGRPLATVTPISSHTKDAIAAIKLLDYHATLQGHELMSFGIEGETFEKLPDGSYQFLGKEKDELKNVLYYGDYSLFDIHYKKEKRWPFSSWVHRTYTNIVNIIESWPSFEPVDAEVHYDVLQWKALDRLPEMKRYFWEQKVRILVGELPIDAWDQVVENWLKIGGNQWIADKNKQFEAVRPQHK